jgi:hypothetical protein
MSKGKVLTKEIAQQYVTKGWKWVSSETNYFASIDEDAAQVLSKFKKGSLQLNGLKAISEKVAQLLALQKGGDAFCGYFALELNGLTEISEQIAEALGRNQGTGGLFLDGLRKISDSAALSISKYQGLQLSLNGIKEISPFAASALANIKDYDGERTASLYLCGLEEISDKVGEALGKFKGSTLNLSGLKQISNTTARSLARAKAQLVLKGLKSLSDEVAKALSLHKGSYYVRERLDLTGLKALSDRSAKYLAVNKKRVLLHGKAEEAYERARVRMKTKRQANKKTSR